jgi:hypothetical protein
MKTKIESTWNSTDTDQKKIRNGDRKKLIRIWRLRPTLRHGGGQISKRKVNICVQSHMICLNIIQILFSKKIERCLRVCMGMSLNFVFSLYLMPLNSFSPVYDIKIVKRSPFKCINKLLFSIITLNTNHFSLFI